ncbi:MAG: ADP-ribosyltransferase domain-containing protein [Actinomycetota bacterium]|nr:ADP-ribosyltransferase domain-containing protein [Actinomycetota bacterium]
MDAETTARAEALSTALSKLPDRPGPVFRGADLTPKQIARYVPGSAAQELGFTSSSFDESRAFSGNTLFLIESTTGKDISGFSGLPESEVLFDKGSRFVVTGNYFDTTIGRQVIIMGEIK